MIIKWSNIYTKYTSNNSTSRVSLSIYRRHKRDAYRFYTFSHQVISKTYAYFQQSKIRSITTLNNSKTEIFCIINRWNSYIFAKAKKITINLIILSRLVQKLFWSVRTENDKLVAPGLPNTSKRKRLCYLGIVRCMWKTTCGFGFSRKTAIKKL